MDFRLAIAQQILSALPEAPLEAADVAAMLEVPPDTKLGDYAFPCFKLSKALRKSPMMIADQLAAAIQADFLARVESVRGYLNFFIDRAIYAERVLAAAEAQGDQLRLGQQRRGQVRGAGLQLHQHRQALPHRPSLHHDDRQRPLQALQVLRLEGRGRQPSGRLGHAVWQDDRRLQKVGRPRDGGARRRGRDGQALRALPQGGGKRPRPRGRGPRLVQEDRGWRRGGPLHLQLVQGSHPQGRAEDLRASGRDLRLLRRRELLQRQDGPHRRGTEGKGPAQGGQGRDDRRSRALRHAPGAHPPLRRRDALSDARPRRRQVPQGYLQL